VTPKRAAAAVSKPTAIAALVSNASAPVCACRDPRVNFRVADAQKLPVADASFERPAAGLVINLYPIRKSD